tara:strand:- start:930 stop:1109 length:180 start_codon:yes stop_codon:yes gene_type:complete
MVDLDELNEDIDFNYSASEILKERAPHLLYELQHEFLQLRLDEGSIIIEPHTGNLVWED